MIYQEKNAQKPGFHVFKIRAALFEAGKLIASQLLFLEPINVLVTFADFCPDDEDQDCDDGERKTRKGFIISQPAQKLGTGQVEPVLLYPQALMKQMDLEHDTPLEHYDIVIEFNANIDWYFSGDTAVDENSKSFNFFELIAAHELTHGLGFASGLTEYKTSDGNSIPFLAPEFVESMYLGFGTNSMAPINVFDTLIFGKNSLLEFGQRINKLGQKKMSQPDYLKEMQQDSDVLSAASELYQMVRGAKLEFRFPDGATAPVFTQADGKFLKGTSLSHFSNELNTTSDYLMTPYTEDGVASNERLQKYRERSIYGPLTLKVMEAIGYPTVRNPEIIKLRGFVMP